MWSKDRASKQHAPSISAVSGLSSSTSASNISFARLSSHPPLAACAEPPRLLPALPPPVLLLALADFFLRPAEEEEEDHILFDGEMLLDDDVVVALRFRLAIIWEGRAGDTADFVGRREIFLTVRGCHYDGLGICREDRTGKIKGT